MAKKKVYFYGKEFGDIKFINQVLQESGKYDIAHTWVNQHKPGKPPSSYDYAITSHNHPTRNLGREIHVQHGFGVGSRVCHLTKEAFINDYVRHYYGLGLYGEQQKQDYVKYGFPEDKVLLLGMPSSIPILQPIIEEDKTAWLKSRGLDTNKKTLLYMPTWDNETPRQLFLHWFDDGKERERVETLCKTICENQNTNLIIRLHENQRYSQNWLNVYADIFKRYRVYAIFLQQDPDIVPYIRYADVFLGDHSNANTYCYVADKPLVHLGTKAANKWAARDGGWPMEDRAGYLTDNFDEMLEYLIDSIKSPDQFSEERKRVVRDNIIHVGDACKEAILNEFARIME